MRALTLWQPWASLIAAGGKRLETRPRRTNYRGPLLIHASAKKCSPSAAADAGLRRALERPAFVEAMLEVLGHADLDRLPYGAIVASSRLEDCNQVPPGLSWEGWQGRSMEREALFGDFSTGRYVWRLDAVSALEIPVAARGAQGLWIPPVDLVARVAVELEREAT